MLGQPACERLQKKVQKEKGKGIKNEESKTKVYECYNKGGEEAEWRRKVKEEKKTRRKEKKKREENNVKKERKTRRKEEKKRKENQKKGK